MHEVTQIHDEMRERYPGLCVQRDGDAVVVHIPVQFRKRNGWRLIVTQGA